MRNDKQSEVVSIERAVKRTIQIQNDKGFFDNYDKADALKKHLVFDEVNERRTPDLDDLNDNDIVTQ